MKQFLIFALDGEDKDAPKRRMDVRPRHLEKVKELKQNNNFVLGGAQLNQDEQMVGSAMVVQFETEEALHVYLSEEPYIVEGVWKTYQVIPFKVANV
jgi:uncharacterized protein